MSPRAPRQPKPDDAATPPGDTRDQADKAATGDPVATEGHSDSQAEDSQQPAELSEWDELAEPVANPPKKSYDFAKPDVLKTVPAPIRKRLEDSLVKSTAAKAKAQASSAKRPRVDYDWQIQKVKDTDQGTKFKRLAEKYAKYRPAEGDIEFRHDSSPVGQITVRAGDPTWFVSVEGEYVPATSAVQDGAFLGVRYSARPLEVRTDASRLPGSA